MNTPAHVILNLVAVRRYPLEKLWPAVLLGALFPDLPMFLFYVVEKGLLGTPERLIWGHAYFQPGWRLLIDLPNSLPLAAAGFFLAWRRGSAWGQAFFASVMLHCLADFLTHNDDAHRHFLPFSDWRFISPVSYWDPRHYGRVLMPLETAGTVAGCLYLALRHPAKGARATAGVTLFAYAGLMGFAWMMWGG